MRKERETWVRKKNKKHIVGERREWRVIVCEKRGERKVRKENKKHIVGERREWKMGTFEKGEREVIEVSDVAKMVSQMKKKGSPNSPIFHQNRGRHSQDFLQSFLLHECLNCKRLTYKSGSFL